jgi:hypothetical protein
MLVGVNFPWLNYGWDFGLGPPAWRGTRTTPHWFDEIDAHLLHLHGLGVRVIRWFVVADGLTYGSGAAAPRADPHNPRRWHFDPGPLDHPFIDHFTELLARIAFFNSRMSPPLLLLPVLVDFTFCQPGALEVMKPTPAAPATQVPDPDWVKRGRAEAIADAAKQKRFLDAVLTPLLQVSQGQRDTIYAWELMNEPEWVTNGWEPNAASNLPVDAGAMRAFLEDGKGRVRSAGFKPTIGFNRIETIEISGITAEINQFHHYASNVRRLGPHVFDPQFPAIVGEFATAETDIWPELGSNQSVLARLKRIAGLGYPMALPWSYLQRDTHTTWTTIVEHHLRVFRDEQVGAGPINAPPA